MPYRRTRPVINHRTRSDIIDGRRRGDYNRGHDGLDDDRGGLLLDNSGLSGCGGRLGSSRRILDDSRRRRRHRCGLRDDGLLINNRGGRGVIDSGRLAHQMRPVAGRRARIRFQGFHQDRTTDYPSEYFTSGCPLAISSFNLAASTCGNCRYSQRNNRSFNQRLHTRLSI